MNPGRLAHGPDEKLGQFGFLGCAMSASVEEGTIGAGACKTSGKRSHCWDSSMVYGWGAGDPAHLQRKCEGVLPLYGETIPPIAVHDEAQPQSTGCGAPPLFPFAQMLPLPR